MDKLYLKWSWHLFISVSKFIPPFYNIPLKQGYFANYKYIFDHERSLCIYTEFQNFSQRRNKVQNLPKVIKMLKDNKGV